jgi:hypothetical protein
VQYGLIPIRTPSQLYALAETERQFKATFLSPTILLRRGGETLQVKKTEPGFLRLQAGLFARPEAAPPAATPADA